MGLTFHGFTTQLKNFLNLRATYNLRSSYEHFVKRMYKRS